VPERRPLTPAAVLALQRTAGNRATGAILQRAFKRRDFSQQTKQDLQVQSGEHRRHIIPNHLMKNMLQAWWSAHQHDAEGKKTSFQKLDTLYDQMNNFQHNLWVGEGAANTAIGMFTTQATKQATKFESTGATPMEMETSLGHFSGFQQAAQKDLVGPVLPALTQDPMISQGTASALPFVQDLQFSTDFDWPENGQYFAQWLEAYQRFLSVKNNAADWPYDGLMNVINGFLSLPDP
jgi:hypothetical protein